MAESARLMGRNGDIWRWYVRGMTQEDIAKKFDVSQATVSSAIAAVRDSIPQQERDALLKEEIDFLRAMRVELLELWDADAPDLVSNGRVMEGIKDHTGRLAAAARIESYSTRLHKLLGLEASQKIELNVGEEAAAQRAAAEAATYLHGGEA